VPEPQRVVWRLAGTAAAMATRPKRVMNEVLMLAVEFLFAGWSLRLSKGLVDCVNWRLMDEDDC
jgi:hypothetical protein